MNQGTLFSNYRGHYLLLTSFAKRQYVSNVSSICRKVVHISASSKGANSDNIMPDSHHLKHRPAACSVQHEAGPPDSWRLQAPTCQILCRDKTEMVLV